MPNNQQPAPPLVDAVASVGSLRTLGTGAQQAAAGNDSRFSGGGVPTSRTISAGAGLTGGGDLSSNRTISIDFSHSGTWTAVQIFSSNMELSGNSQLITSNTAPALMRLGQNTTNESVWSLNVDQNNSDALDDATDSAWKFSLATVNNGAYDGFKMQYSAAGAGTWTPADLFVFDGSGSLTVDGGIATNGNGDWALSGQSSGFLFAPSIGILSTSQTSIAFNGSDVILGNASGSLGTSNVQLNGTVTINTIQVNPNATTPTSGQVLAFNGTAFVPAPAGSGVSSIASVGAVPNSAGGSIATSVLTLQPADGTHPGVITSGTQTIGGAKTFSGTMNVANIDATTLNYGPTTATTVNIANASSTNTIFGNTTVQGPFTAFNGAFLLQGNAASTIETTGTNSLTIVAVGSGNIGIGSSGSGQVNIAQGSSVSQLNLGPSNGTGPINVGGILNFGSNTVFGSGTNLNFATSSAGNTGHFLQISGTPSTIGAQGDFIEVIGGNGANGSASVVGGTGGATIFAAGNGGTGSSSTAGGIGGQPSINGGVGGNGGATGAGGTGGTVNITPGGGGTAGSSGSAVGGDAGNLQIFANFGGNAFSTGNGGAGSSILALCGTGGTANGTGTGGIGGASHFTSGNGGLSINGHGGTGGSLFFTAGNGGATSASGQAAGDGGGLNIQGGVGGTAPSGGFAGNGGFSQILGANGGASASGSNFAGAGGQLNIAAGNAGTATGLGNNGGNLVLNSGNGSGTFGPGTITIDTGTGGSGNSILIGNTTASTITLGRSGKPISNNGINQFPNPGTTLTAAGTISLTNHIEAIAGGTTVTTINLPAAASSSSSGVYYLCVTNAGTVTFGTGGNLALAAPVTVLAGTLVTCVWEAQTTKWYIKG
jgi:hypothetical protein